MTKRALAFTFILAFLPFAANAAQNSAHIVLDSNVTVGATELPKGDLQGRVDWNRSKCTGNVHQRRLDQNCSGTHRRRAEQYRS